MEGGAQKRLTVDTASKDFHQKNVRTSETTLWVITGAYNSEGRGTGSYLDQIAEGLAESFNIKILSVRPDHFRQVPPASKKKIHKSEKLFQSIGGALDKKNIFYRLINTIVSSLRIFFELILNLQKGDKILAVTIPLSLPFIIAFAALMCGGSYIFVIQDNYPEILIAAGKLKESSFFAKFLNFSNRWSYKYASKMIVANRDMAELVKRKTGGLDIPVVCIPNWVDSERFKPLPRRESSILSELGLQERFVFLYECNMEYTDDLVSIVRCALKLIANDTIHFLLSGSEEMGKSLKSEAKEKNLNNITWLTPDPASARNLLLNACDIAIVSVVKKMYSVPAPGDIYNFMAAGKPILGLAEDDTEAAKIIEEEKNGWIVPPGEPGMLFQTILKIFEEREEIEEMSRRSRDAALNKYSKEKVIRRYKDCVK